MLAGMKRPLPLSGLRAFEAVTRTGSLRAASDDLSLTPSAVSHAIRSLERELGTMLFEREGRSIRLTPEGETLMRHVERGFSELQLGVGNVAARGPQLLKLHSAPSFAAQWLMPRLRRLLQECPGLELRIAAGTDYTHFIADEFDADIVYGAMPPDFYGASARQGLVVLPLGTRGRGALPCRPGGHLPGGLTQTPMPPANPARFTEHDARGHCAPQSAHGASWFSEGLRRLVRVFPRGSAAQEFERRKDERLRRGESDGRAEEVSVR